MKWVIAIVLSGILHCIGCSDSGPTAETPIEAPSQGIIEASITGMDCTGCTSSVCAAVDAIPGVNGSTADLATGKFTANLDEGADALAAVAEIEKVIAVLDAGKYTIETIQALTPEGEVVAEPETPSQNQQPTGDRQAT